MSDCKIIVSNLSRSYTEDDLTVQVHIYRVEPATEWTLEIVDAVDTSIVWTTLFESDKAAWDEFASGVAAIGLKSLVNADEIETVTIH